MDTERCDQCGFDATHYSDDDVRGTMRSLAPWWRLLLADVPTAVLEARPDAKTWSAYEYLAHTAEVLTLHDIGLRAILDEDNLDFGGEQLLDPIAAAPATGSIEPHITAIEQLSAEIAKHVEAAGRSPHRATHGDSVILPAALVRHSCHDVLHHFSDVGRGFAHLGVGVAHHVGTIEQINANNGGVAKQPVDSAHIGPRGVVGDRQGNRLHHGRAWQALCLFPSEAVRDLQADGHPISAGSVGENLTVSGVSWASLRPNTRIRLGASATIELSLPAIPCSHNARWFTDGDFNRLQHQRNPAHTRWYASVLTEGDIAPGDPVVIEP